MLYQHNPLPTQCSLPSQSFPSTMLSSSTMLSPSTCSHRLQYQHCALFRIGKCTAFTKPSQNIADLEIGELSQLGVLVSAASRLLAILCCYYAEVWMTCGALWPQKLTMRQPAMLPPKRTHSRSMCCCCRQCCRRVVFGAKVMSLS